MANSIPVPRDYFSAVPYRSGKLKHWHVRYRRAGVVYTFIADNRKELQRLRKKYIADKFVPEDFVPPPEIEEKQEVVKVIYPEVIDDWGWHYVLEGTHVTMFDAEGEIMPMINGEGNKVESFCVASYFYSFREPDIKMLKERNGIFDVKIKRFTRKGLVRVPGKSRRQRDGMEFFLIFALAKVEFWNGSPRFELPPWYFYPLSEKAFHKLWKPKGYDRIEVFLEDIPKVTTVSLEELIREHKVKVIQQSTLDRPADIIKKRRKNWLKSPKPIPVISRKSRAKVAAMQQKNARIEGRFQKATDSALTKLRKYREHKKFTERVRVIRNKRRIYGWARRDTHGRV